VGGHVFVSPTKLRPWFCVFTHWARVCSSSLSVVFFLLLNRVRTLSAYCVTCCNISDYQFGLGTVLNIQIYFKQSWAFCKTLTNLLQLNLTTMGVERGYFASLEYDISCQIFSKKRSFSWFRVGKIKFGHFFPPVEKNPSDTHAHNTKKFLNYRPIKHAIRNLIQPDHTENVFHKFTERISDTMTLSK